MSETNPKDAPPGNHPTMRHLIGSSLLSLLVVLILLVVLRFLLPPMLEFSRYSWHRGHLRAEYEQSGQRLEKISLDGLSEVSRWVTKRAQPSVVHITVSNQQPLNATLSRKPKDTVPRTGPNRETRWNSESILDGLSPSGQGSGVIVSDDGHILTNHHVLNGGVDITVYLADQRIVQAEIIGVDPTTDLALLKIDANDLLPIDWGDSDNTEIGSPVWAIGSPFGLTGSVSFGILSGKHRVDLNANPQYRSSRERISSRYSDLMQSDVAVNPGNSGGPLVNGRGELIGINTAIVGETYRGVSFSIPSSVAKTVYQQLIQNGRVCRGWLGVELVPEILSETATENPSVVVRALVPDSPAALAGLEPGDRILKLNNIDIVSVEQAIDTIRDTPAGDTIDIHLQRDGQTSVVQATLGELRFAP
ncbi:MAG: PDZ domain-containing protein [Planctomycetota bacterium]|nr:MAG: PDZ domain-containing protein [Planctomycetota bacterium]RLT13835.1 MAG: PDZ domain-containing protein [Planctomycetota bacterium]